MNGVEVKDYYSILGVDKSASTAEIETFRGKVKIDIPEGSDNGKILRLKGMGMPVYPGNKGYGDLFVKLRVQLPRSLSKKERELFRQLRDLRGL